MTPPKGKGKDVAGVVLVFLDEAGRAIAHAADFHRDRPGGYSLEEAQRLRAKRALGVAVCRAYASDQLVRAIEGYDCERILQNLVNKFGCRIHQISIGHNKEARL